MLRGMRLTQERPDDLNWIRRYDERSLHVGERQYAGPVIVAPQTVIAPWPAVEVSRLDAAALLPALNLKPKILLLAIPGSAADLPIEVRREMRERMIGLETMDRGAACRTYNVLAAEGREVIAVFW